MAVTQTRRPADKDAAGESSARSRGTRRRKRVARTASTEKPTATIQAPGAASKKKTRKRASPKRKKTASSAEPAAVPASSGSASKLTELVTVAEPVSADVGGGSPANRGGEPAAKKKRSGRRTGKKQAARRAAAGREDKPGVEPPAAAETAAPAAGPTDGDSAAGGPRSDSRAPAAHQDAAEAKAPGRRRRRRGRRGRASDAPDADPTTVAGGDAAAQRTAPRSNEAFGVGLLEPPNVISSPPAKGRGRHRRRPSPHDATALADDDRGVDQARPAPSEPAGTQDTIAKPAAARPARERTRQDRARPARRSKDQTAGQKPAAGKVAAGPEMIINVSAGDECRIAVLEQGRLEELFIERQSAESHVGSIYKGKVTNVEPSIQAVFVDFGHPKNGFLHISDVHPQYFPDGNASTSEDVGKKIPRRDRPPIQKCFRRGQEVVVQVTKEGIGTKGPALTSYLSIPGRFLVMMPGMKRLGVSRKIEDEADRQSMRDVLRQLELPEGQGFILRTAGLGRTKRELQRDLNYLSRLWKIIDQRVRKKHAPAELYQESDLVIRTIRDVLTSDFKRIVVDHEPTAEKAREFLKIALPRSPNMVEIHDGHQPIFHKFGIEEEIERINARHVPLPLGGSIVIESTEAMVAIDVNSGKFRDVNDAEESAFRINMQAAEEIGRQLRLRDLGGLIVCDFIDMRFEKHNRAVERCLRDALKKHKERARILRMSAFGLLEITRQRQRTSIRRSIYTECPHCSGSGTVKSAESMALEVMRVLQLVSHQASVRKVLVSVSPEVAFLVQNHKRPQLHQMEVDTGASITIRGEPQYAVDQLTHECEDQRGRSVSPST